MAAKRKISSGKENVRHDGTGEAGKVTIWSGAFIALLAVNFLQAMGQTIAITLLPLYARSLGASASLIGFITGAFAITALAIRPFSGPAFDSFSQKKLLLISIVIMMAANIGYMLSSNITMVIVMRLIHGVAIGATGPLSMSLVGEALPEEKLDSGISVYMLAFSVAQAIGPAFAVWCSGALGFSLTFAFSAGSLACSALVVALLVHEKPHPNRPPYQIRLSRIFAKQAIVPAILLALLSMGFGCTNAFMVIYGQVRGVDQIGLYFTVYAVSLLVSRPVFGSLTDKLGTTKVLIPAICVFALSYVLIGMSTTLAGFLASAVVAACGFGICSPLLQALVFKVTPHRFRGAGSNTSYTGLDVGNLIGPYAGGMVVDVILPACGGSEAMAYSGMWMIMVIPIAAALVFFLLERKRLLGYEHELLGSDDGE